MNINKIKKVLLSLTSIALILLIILLTNLSKAIDFETIIFILLIFTTTIFLSKIYIHIILNLTEKEILDEIKKQHNDSVAIIIGAIIFGTSIVIVFSILALAWK